MYMVVESKVCTRCGVKKPLISFAPNRRATDGRSSWCRACINAVAAERRHRKNAGAISPAQTATPQVEPQAEPQVDSKVCTRCWVTKPLTEFHRDTRLQDGHTDWCRECHNAMPLERYYQVNYPPLTQGACNEGLMETTTMQFNSPEGCFIQPYSCRPVDAAPTDYPWNHGITGYFPSLYRRTSYASSSGLKSPLQESASVHQYLKYRHQNTKTLRRGNSSPRLRGGSPCPFEMNEEAFPRNGVQSIDTPILRGYRWT